MPEPLKILAVLAVAALAAGARERGDATKKGSKVFPHRVHLVLEVTGEGAVLEDLLRAKPPGVEVIGAGSLRFFWDLLQDGVKTARRFQALLEAGRAVSRSLEMKQTIRVILETRRWCWWFATDKTWQSGWCHSSSSSRCAPQSSGNSECSLRSSKQ